MHLLLVLRNGPMITRLEGTVSTAEALFASVRVAMRNQRDFLAKRAGTEFTENEEELVTCN